MLKSSENSATIIKSKGMAILWHIKRVSKLSQKLKSLFIISWNGIILPIQTNPRKRIYISNHRRRRRIIGDPSVNSVWQKLFVVAAHLIFKCSATYQRYGNLIGFQFQDINQSNSNRFPSLVGLEQVRFLLWVLMRNLILGS